MFIAVERQIVYCCFRSKICWIAGGNYGVTDRNFQRLAFLTCYWFCYFFRLSINVSFCLEFLPIGQFLFLHQSANFYSKRKINVFAFLSITEINIANKCNTNHILSIQKQLNPSAIPFHLYAITAKHDNTDLHANTTKADWPLIINQRKCHLRGYDTSKLHSKKCTCHGIIPHSKEVIDRQLEVHCAQEAEWS